MNRLAKEKMTPSVEADRFTLIRRVSLDLTGIPPTPLEVENFLNDKSPNAYEKLWPGCWIHRNMASDGVGFG